MGLKELTKTFLQDAYDDLMRRKINYQTPEYVQNNELICFGLSSHDSEEWQIKWTPQAEKELAIVRKTLN